MAGDKQTYGSADVARAAGVARPAFDSWLLGKYLPLPPGPGTGRARHYSLLDAVRVAAMSHMTFLGVMPNRAGKYAELIKEIPRPGDMLVLTADPVARRSLAVVAPPGADIHHAINLASATDADGVPVRPAGRYILDLHELTEQVRRGLSDPEWRDHQQPERRVYLTRWPANPTDAETQAARDFVTPERRKPVRKRKRAVVAA
jgi:hypothetical protein